MKIAIASGKGGTGKTTIATSLAYVAASDGRTVAYLDCDVEEPNGHLFLKPRIVREEPIHRPVPVVDSARCTHCTLCSRACRYGAIACVGEQTLVFTELCHACGGCVWDLDRKFSQPMGPGPIWRHLRRGRRLNTWKFCSTRSATEAGLAGKYVQTES